MTALEAKEIATTAIKASIISEMEFINEEIERRALLGQFYAEYKMSDIMLHNDFIIDGIIDRLECMGYEAIIMGNFHEYLCINW